MRALERDARESAGAGVGSAVLWGKAPARGRSVPGLDRPGPRAIPFALQRAMRIELVLRRDPPQPAQEALQHRSPSLCTLADHQLVAVEASISPTDASQRSASMAALQPSPAAVTAWR